MEEIEQPVKGRQHPMVPHISMFGKLVSVILAVTPLPTYLGVWGKTKKEQIARVESISF
jgi:hypothetical protein